MPATGVLITAFALRVYVLFDQLSSSPLTADKMPAIHVLIVLALPASHTGSQAVLIRGLHPH